MPQIPIVVDLQTGLFTRAKIPIRLLVRLSCQFMRPPPTHRLLRASIKDMSIPGRVIPLARHWKSVSAALEGGERGLAFASGLAATTAVFFLTTSR
jgi:hypothetical protein